MMPVSLGVSKRMLNDITLRFVVCADATVAMANRAVAKSFLIVVIKLSINYAVCL